MVTSARLCATDAALRGPGQGPANPPARVNWASANPAATVVRSVTRSCRSGPPGAPVSTAANRTGDTGCVRSAAPSSAGGVSAVRYTTAPGSRGGAYATRNRPRSSVRAPPSRRGRSPNRVPASNTVTMAPGTGPLPPRTSPPRWISPPPPGPGSPDAGHGPAATATEIRAASRAAR